MAASVPNTKCCSHESPFADLFARFDKICSKQQFNSILVRNTSLTEECEFSKIEVFQTFENKFISLKLL